MVKTFLPAIVTKAKIIYGEQCDSYLKCIPFFLSIEDTQKILLKFKHTNMRYCRNLLYCWMKV